ELLEEQGTVLGIVKDQRVPIKKWIHGRLGQTGASQYSLACTAVARNQVVRTSHEGPPRVARTGEVQQGAATAQHAFRTQWRFLPFALQYSLDRICLRIVHTLKIGVDSGI